MFQKDNPLPLTLEKDNEISGLQCETGRRHPYLMDNQFISKIKLNCCFPIYQQKYQQYFLPPKNQNLRSSFIYGKALQRIHQFASINHA